MEPTRWALPQNHRGVLRCYQLLKQIFYDPDILIHPV